MSRSVPFRLARFGAAALLALALSSTLATRTGSAADPPQTDGAWLATQAMGTALASTLAAAKVDVTWTKGLDQESGKPIEYDPSKQVQRYNAAVTPHRPGSAM